jgi:outer membrane lipoprotein SlyB
MPRFRHTLLAAALATTLASTAFVGLTPATALAAPGASYEQRDQRDQRSGYAPRVTAFDVKGVSRVEAGTELDFTLWGTPGGQASLQIDGAQRMLYLGETSPGVYQGSYTVSRRDRINPESKVTANLRHDNRVATALLSEPLQLGWPSPLAAATTPQITQVRVTEEGGRRRDDRLRFTVYGTPGGHASVRMEGSTPRMLVLDEVKPGEYSTVYTLERQDTIDTSRPLQSSLRVGNRSTTQVTANAYDRVNLHDRHAVACMDCGVVQAIHQVQVDGDGRVLGTVAGGVLGAVVGSQFGKGNGRTAAGVAGALGGALIGREIERRSDRRTQYEVVVRTTDGQERTVLFDDEPKWQVGDAVRLVGDTLERRS